MHHEQLGEFEIEDGFAELAPIGPEDQPIDVTIEASEREPDTADIEGLAKACQSHPEFSAIALREVREHHEELLDAALEVWSEDDPGILAAFNPQAKSVADISGDQAASLLDLAEIRLETSSPSRIAFDFHFRIETMDYLICARFDLNGHLTEVALES